MAYIPPDKQPFPTFSSGQAEDPNALLQKDALTSRISSISLSILAEPTESTTSIAPPSRGFTVTIKSGEEKPFQLVPSWPDMPRKFSQSEDSVLKQCFLVNLKFLKAPYPLDFFQKILPRIENVDTLLEIWTELIKKPEDESLDDLLVNVFQAIYEKDRDLSFTAYTQTGQRLEIKKRIADCINPDDYEFFLDKVIEKNAHFSIALFSKKFYDKCEREKNLDYLRFDLTPSPGSQGERICHALYRIYNIKALDKLEGLTLNEFQHLCSYFFEAGWGTKEEFISKALCSFWNEITSTDSKKIKTYLESLENAIHDIGSQQDPTLFSGNLPHFVLLFSVGILYPTIQEKIRARESSPFQVKPSELERDYAALGPDPKRFVNKIRTLLLPPEGAIKNLEEVDPLNTESFPCIRAKHPQFSGSCAIKNLNSLLSMSSTAPSIILHGGFKHHSVYAEIFKLDNQYFALVHNLGAGSDIHRRDHGEKILPLALYFEEKEHLIEFSKIFSNEDTTGDEYLASVKNYMFDVTDPESSSPFVTSLSSIDSRRTNPMYPEYQKFRILEKEIIRKLIDLTGSPSEVKGKASDVRRNQKRSLGGGQ